MLIPNVNVIPFSVVVIIGYNITNNLYSLKCVNTQTGYMWFNQTNIKC